MPLFGIDFARLWPGVKGVADTHRPMQSRSASLPIIFTAGGSDDGVPASYEAQVRTLFCRNAVAQASLRFITDAVSEISIDASDARAASLIAAPSAGQNLLETLAVHLLLHGNAYVQIVEDGAGGVAELYALRPERVSVEADTDGWPRAYLYRTGSSVARLLPTDAAGMPTIIHLKSVHPADDHYGLGRLGAAASAMAIHNAAARWNKALLDNAARPSGALVHDGSATGATLSPDQFDRLKEELAAHYAGAVNAGRPLVLDGNLKWQTMSLSPADMDFVALKDAAAREIAMAFGVPPMLLGLPGDATYANYKEANRALWRNHIVPLTGRILSGLAHGLDGWFAAEDLSDVPDREHPPLTLTVNMNQIPALAEERERLWAQVGSVDFLTRDEKRAMLGIDGRAPQK